MISILFSSAGVDQRAGAGVQRHQPLLDQRRKLEAAADLVDDCFFFECLDHVAIPSCTKYVADSFNRRIERVVDDGVLVFAGPVDLAAGHFEPPLDGVFRFGGSRPQPPLKFLLPSRGGGRSTGPRESRPGPWPPHPHQYLK